LTWILEGAGKPDTYPLLLDYKKEKESKLRKQENIPKY
jgi:hypothetical protein